MGSGTSSEDSQNTCTETIDDVSNGVTVVSMNNGASIFENGEIERDERGHENNHRKGTCISNINSIYSNIVSNIVEIM